jgi:epoxyqueuosine reductase QueG
MEQMIAAEIGRFMHECPENRFPDGTPFFNEPLVGFAAATDPLFTEYKRIIGDFHLTPDEFMAHAFGAGVRAASVVVWVLPIVQATRESNRRQTQWPSREWAQTRSFGEQCNAALRRHLVAWLETRGQKALAPQFSPAWQELAATPVGIASTWSERHAAYAAGLGTFSLNDALITVRGIAHRLGSVITDLPLQPTGRPWPDYRYNCLYHREGGCGICIDRCPVGALSRAGHDKKRCREYVYGEVPRQVGAEYNVPYTGCGLCQTKVPCEAQVPPGRGEKRVSA